MTGLGLQWWGRVCLEGIQNLKGSIFGSEASKVFCQCGLAVKSQFFHVHCRTRKFLEHRREQSVGQRKAVFGGLSHCSMRLWVGPTMFAWAVLIVMGVCMSHGHAIDHVQMRDNSLISCLVRLSILVPLLFWMAKSFVKGREGPRMRCWTNFDRQWKVISCRKMCVGRLRYPERYQWWPIVLPFLKRLA